MSPRMYALFMFELLHTLHLIQLGISEMLKEGVLSYMSSETILTDGSTMLSQPKSLPQASKFVLRGFNTYLAAIENNSSGSRLKINFFQVSASSYLNELFTNTCIRGISKRKDYCRLDKVLPSVIGSVDRDTGLVELVPMTRLHNMYSDLVHSLKDYKVMECSDESRIGQLRRSMQQFKLLLKGKSDEHCETGLYTLKVYLLDNVVDGLKKFVSLDIPDALAFEKINVPINGSYQSIAQRQS